MKIAELSVTINARFDSVIDIAQEIGELQTYKLFPDDDMLLIDRNDALEVLKRHVVVEKE